MKPVISWGILFSMMIALVLATPAHAMCMVMTQDGYMPDYDCDGVVDQADNCPHTINADQRDSNRNSVGDVCDLLIEEVIVNPDNHLRQGDFAHITVRMINNRDKPLTGITVTFKNSNLGIDASQKLGLIPQGETGVVDVWVKVPKCAGVKSYPISITASFTDPLNSKSTTETQQETLYIEKGTVCGTTDGPLDNTIINAFDHVDIDRGQNALIPITITNLGDNQATYDLYVEDLSSWGSWGIDPAPQMTLISGHRDEVLLYLQTESHTPAGKHVIYVTVTSGKQKTTIPINVYVRGVGSQAGIGIWVLFVQVMFLFLLIALIFAAIIIAVRTTRRGKNDGKKSDGKDGQHKVEPYYDDNSSGAAMTTSAAVQRKNDIPSNKISSNKIQYNKIPSNKKNVSIERAENSRVETYY